MNADIVVSVTPTLVRFLGEEAAEEALQLFDPHVPEDAEFLRRIVAQLDEAESILLNELPKIIETPAQQASIIALEGRAYVVEKEMDRIRTDRVAPLNNIVKATNNLINDSIARLLSTYGKKGSSVALGDLYRRMEAQRIQREKDEALRRQTEAALAEQEAMRKAAEAKTEEERKAAMAEAEEASKAQVVAEVEAPREQVRGIKTADGKVTYRKVWTHEVVDEKQLPREYLMVNDAAIKAAIQAGKRVIAGVNIFETEARRRGV